ncbi:hypothetical protein LMH87_005482 [Akanthomyces muscarius]|uniref:Ras GTPase activating protein n=1 Tax=Akanthomyces muscarius TaxID=2231603 RepID=A0A9W8QNW2_AKAMU|nr:hypothetical protein LMH87_005482 [Akanthomyces muscarius]KAJ4163774.1 hypothetical protein LMH87_005482 [Akanthomyces muscarius]
MFRPHPLRQSQTLEVVPPDNNISRQLSTTSSSASSGYSYASDQTQNTQYSTLSSAYSPPKPTTTAAHTHKRGQSDVIARARLFESGEMNGSTRDAMPTRQSLRQLPQGPASSPPKPSTSPEQKLRHLRGQSVDISKLSISQHDGPSSPVSPPRMSSMRPNSMLLTRSDSILRGAGAVVPSNSAHIRAPELEQLGRSSTSQLRTLSKLAQSNTADDFAITSPTQEVVGLRGRRRLQRTEQPGAGKTPKSNAYGWEGRNWMDKQRQFLQAYEYLCHIGEAREWIEDVTNKTLPPIVELEEALRDGVTLAEVVEALNPDRHFRIFRHPKLQFRHSDNIAIFFRYLDEVEMPDLFRFELIDLYEKKNIPKVIYCIHALSWLLFRKGIVDFRIGNLVGQLEFEHHELEAMQKGLDKLGVNMPSFGNMGADFGVPEPEPQETEEERIDRELAEQSAQITDLQAQIRGALARLRLGDAMQDLWDGERALINLQARIRGDFTRQIMGYRLQMRRSSIMVQSAARGCLVRRRMKNNDRCWKAIEPDVLTLQSIIRANKVRKEISRERAAMQSFASPLAMLQSLVRGKAARANHVGTQIEIKSHSPDIGKFQAAIRGAAVRCEIASQLDSLRLNEPSTVELQSRIRGMFERQSVFALQKKLDRENPIVTSLQSRIRGFNHRRQHQALMEELASHNAETAAFQAILKAMMERARVDDVLTELFEEEESIVQLQSAARAFLVRARFEEKKRFFNENMQKVIKIQSFVRAKVQGEAYKSLTTGKNPPVNAVKNFVHLLNDSDFDFNEEVEFERMRKTVVQQVRQNEMLEQYIDQLDIKIALLVKNKITLDEVVSHQHNYGGGSSMGMLANSSISSSNQFDLKALNKGSRKKLESYQQLFFCLQTQPQYLARLFKHLREQGTPDGESKRIELLVMSMFGYAQKRREEYYLLKLIARSIREEIEGNRSLQEYHRGTYFWSKLLANYTRSPRDRKFLRGLLGPLVRDNIVEDPALDLESDPMQIYRAAINNEELRTGRPDGRPLDVPREVAIRDPETRRLFIDHLRDLREICDQFFLAMEDHVFKTPYGLRFLCRQMFESLRQHFNRDSPDVLLQHVTNWYWKFYLQPAIVSPENVGVIEKTLSPLQKRNLCEVAKVIGQIASGRPFGGENVYLQPLNAFVAESVERLRRIMSELISVPDAESTFDIDEFNDLYAKNKPTLYIKMADVFSIHNLIVSQLPFMCLTRDDVLREIIQDLGSAKTNESEMSAAGSSDIQMFLTPKLHNVEDPDAEVKALFMETKRCVLYIIRVQTGANLLEILVKPITDEDDAKWASLLQDDFAASGSHGAYSDSHMVDVTRMSYYELKRTALENVMRLEQMGRISKHNNYQDILNAIASDIRSKSRRRVQRQRELEGVNLTLGNLHEKANYLEQQRKSYDDYIEQAMMTLQNKKGKKRFLMPFTKQYNHQRELERSGKVPKFGSYMYSARALSDKGVLVSWKGMSDWDKINVTISCDQVGVFVIEGTRGHIQMPGAHAVVSIEDLLQAQFEAHQFMHLFEGNLKLNVNLLLHLVYKKFYRTQ